MCYLWLQIERAAKGVVQDVLCTEWPDTPPTDP